MDGRVIEGNLRQILMTTPTTAVPKYRQALMMLVFIALAAWGGWGLAKMGEDRSMAKAEAEASRITGVGEVKEREPDTAPSVPAEKHSAPTKAPEALGEKAAPAKEPVKEPVREPEPEATPPPAQVGPPVLIVRSVPLAEVWVTDAAGTRPVGMVDAAGAFSITTLPAGEYTIEVRHADYRPLSSPLAVSLKAGETVERLIAPESKPGTLILLTDEGVVARLDGRKVGGYMLMLGNLPSKRALTLSLVDADGRVKEEVLTLAPRESRMIDRRTPVVAKAESAPVVEPASDRLRPAPVAVKLVSVTPESGLVALVSAASKETAPLAKGKTGELRLSGGSIALKVKCERIFAGVSVCRAEGVLPSEVPSEPCELIR